MQQILVIRCLRTCPCHHYPLSLAYIHVGWDHLKSLYKVEESKYSRRVTVPTQLYIMILESVDRRYLHIIHECENVRELPWVAVVDMISKDFVISIGGLLKTLYDIIRRRQTANEEKIIVYPVFRSVCLRNEYFTGSSPLDGSLVVSTTNKSEVSKNTTMAVSHHPKWTPTWFWLTLCLLPPL